MVWAAVRFQLSSSRRTPGDIEALATVPLLTAIFLAIMLNSGRDDLIGHAVIGPVLMAMSVMALNVAGEIIQSDRYAGTLELVIAAPANMVVVLWGRVLAVVALGMLSLVEAWLVAWLGFGIVIKVPHAGVFAVTLAASAFAMAGTATLAASLFVLTRRGFAYRVAISFPLYILGGVIVPIAFLPEWLQPLSRLVYLSWSADLLRASLRPEPVTGVAPALLAILALAFASVLIGRRLLAWVVGRVRSDGTLAQL